MADFFISYDHDDKPLAQRLAAALEKQGVEVWWDRSLVAGDRFRSVIGRELRDADAVIVIWTANSVESDFVRDEADRANKDNKLVPVAFAWDFEIPLGFGQVHVANLAAWRDDAAAPEIQDLLAKREAIKGGRFHKVLKAKDAAPRTAASRINDAFALFSRLGSNVGGITYDRFLLGALGCALVFLLVQLLGGMMPSGSQNYGPVELAISFVLWLLGFLVVRAIYQFILLAKNKSAVWFLDEAFIFWIAFSGLAAALLLVLTYNFDGPFELGFYLEQFPLIAFLVLAAIGILRSIFWGLRVAASRL